MKFFSLEKKKKKTYTHKSLSLLPWKKFFIPPFSGMRMIMFAWGAYYYAKYCFNTMQKMKVPELIIPEVSS